MIEITNVIISEFSLSADVSLINAAQNGSFKLTTVYGPTDRALKDQFFAELVALKPTPGVRWLVPGDFNQIRRARDKNKGNVDRSRLMRFRDALQTCELTEVHLQNRRFTWSNERASPTLCKLDAFYCNAEWDLRFGTHVLYALSSSLSDHCPLLLADTSGPKRTKAFRFENFWLKLPGFDDVVKEAWTRTTTHIEPCQILYHKLKETGKCLHKWGKGIYSNTKVMLHAALLVILQLDARSSTTFSGRG
jgi:hypothetical protein